MVSFYWKAPKPKADTRMQVYSVAKRNSTPRGPPSPVLAWSALFTLCSSYLGNQTLTCGDFFICHEPSTSQRPETLKISLISTFIVGDRCETKLQQKMAWWTGHRSKGDWMNQKFNGLTLGRAWCRLITQRCFAKETANPFPSHSCSSTEARNSLREFSEIPLPCAKQGPHDWRFYSITAGQSCF